jgi:hypothetical protein
MATIKTLSLAVILTITSLFINQSANAQTGVPAEVASITQMNLEEGQEKLTGLGYEVCSSSLFGKKQDWFNESTQNCVTIKFNRKKVITEVLPNPETSECQKGLDASRTMWEKYHDGQAPVSTAKLDEERKKLVDKGFKVSYWIDEITPGRSQNIG